MMTSFQSRPVMKDSGVEGLGEVPSHWEVRRFRTVANIQFSNVDKHSKDHEQPVRLCNYPEAHYNDSIRADMKFMRATATTDETERFRLVSGDVLITKDSESWDDIGVPAFVETSSADLVCGYHLAILRPLRRIIHGTFLYRALPSEGVANQLAVCANGITRFGLSQAAIKACFLCLPPFVEQVSIARFLDQVTSRLDRYIRALENLIALLEEEKQVVVQNAVTGRINVRTGKPYPAYKPSGVEWLREEVPTQWRVKRLKSVVRHVSKKLTSRRRVCRILPWNTSRVGQVE